MIPVRRSLDGQVLAGDSACMVIPAYRSGVACSLIAGDLAARHIARCIEEGDTGRETL
ncbi:MAG: hypothetical protein SWK76_17830 [Actinomycetota bacterium]|nr:hypothetical protein [Actinomycetota bacterium]